MRFAKLLRAFMFRRVLLWNEGKQNGRGGAGTEGGQAKGIKAKNNCLYYGERDGIRGAVRPAAPRHATPRDRPRSEKTLTDVSYHNVGGVFRAVHSASGHHGGEGGAL